MELTMIDNFRVVSKIADTKWGQIYHVKPLGLERSYALKITESHHDRILSECRILEKLRTHPNVIDIYFSGELNGNPYIVEEFVPSDLRVVTKLDSLLHWRESLQVVEQILAALDHAHSKNVIHQDLKPANVLITRDPATRSLTVKVCDFDLSQQQEICENSVEDVKEVAGTLEYSSPEQRQGARLDHRTDIFNVGLIFYELLTGIRPGVASQPASEIYNNSRAPITDPVPAWVDAIIAKALQQDRGLRFNSAQAMLNAITEGKAPEKVKLRKKVWAGTKRTAQAIKNAMVAFVTFALMLPIRIVFLPIVVAMYLTQYLENKRWIDAGSTLCTFLLLAALGSGAYYGWGLTSLANHNFRQSLREIPATGTIVYRVKESATKTGYVLVGGTSLPHVDATFVFAPDGRDVFTLSPNGSNFVYLTEDSIVRVDLRTGQTTTLARSEIFKFFTKLTFKDDLIVARLNEETWTVDQAGELSLVPPNIDADFERPLTSHPYELDITSDNKIQVQFGSLMPGHVTLGTCRDEQEQSLAWFPACIH